MPLLPSLNCRFCFPFTNPSPPSGFMTILKADVSKSNKHTKRQAYDNHDTSLQVINMNNNTQNNKSVTVLCSLCAYMYMMSYQLGKRGYASFVYSPTISFLFYYRLLFKIEVYSKVNTLSPYLLLILL